MRIVSAAAVPRAVATSPSGWTRVERGGRDAHRHRHPFSEEDGLRVALRDVSEDPGPQRPPSERFAIPSKGHLVFGAARNVIKDRPRHLRPCHVLELEEVREPDRHADANRSAPLALCPGPRLGELGTAVRAKRCRQIAPHTAGSAEFWRPFSASIDCPGGPRSGRAVAPTVAEQPDQQFDGTEDEGSDADERERRGH